MEQIEGWASGAQRAVEQTATAAVVLSLRWAIVVVLSCALAILRMSRWF